MTPKFIFLPVCTLVAFTFAVGLRLMQTRVGLLRRKRINAQELANGSKWDSILADVENPADAFENLFEVPVLFYMIILAVFTTGKVDYFYGVTAWIFVFFRILQGVIHCSYNKVIHRAAMFWLGSAVLLVMWIRFAFVLCSDRSN